MKKVISLIMSLLLCFLMTFTVSAAEKPLVSISSAENLNAGDTFDLVVSISSNTGLTSLQVNIDYNHTYFVLQKIKDAGILGSTVHTPVANSKTNLSWQNGLKTENFTSNGTLATLTFKVADEVPSGKYPFILSYTAGNVLDCNMNRVAIDLSSGSVFVNSKCGDINNDGKVNAADIMLLQRYVAGWYNEGFGNITFIIVVADVNKKGSGNGKINAADTMVLQRNVAEWADFQILPLI